jgi:hypothetical protein
VRQWQDCGEIIYFIKALAFKGFRHFIRAENLEDQLVRITTIRKGEHRMQAVL